MLLPFLSRLIYLSSNPSLPPSLSLSAYCLPYQSFSRSLPYHIVHSTSPSNVLSLPSHSLSPPTNPILPPPNFHSPVYLFIHTFLTSFPSCPIYLPINPALAPSPSLSAATFLPQSLARTHTELRPEPPCPWSVSCKQPPLQEPMTLPRAGRSVNSQTPGGEGCLFADCPHPSPRLFLAPHSSLLPSARLFPYLPQPLLPVALTLPRRSSSPHSFPSILLPSISFHSALLLPLYR